MPTMVVRAAPNLRTCVRAISRRRASTGSAIGDRSALIGFRRPRGAGPMMVPQIAASIQGAFPLGFDKTAEVAGDRWSAVAVGKREIVGRSHFHEAGDDAGEFESLETVAAGVKLRRLGGG